MTPKNSSQPYVLVAVAPSSTSFLRLGEILETFCKSEKIPATDVRRIGGEYRWTAVELTVDLSADTAAAIRPSFESSLNAIADCAIVSVQNRRKKLLISDMDSTIIEQECLDELAGYAGLKDEIAAITARAMAGELDFEGALTERVGKLKGLNLDALQKCYDERISLMAGAKTLTATMKHHGAACILVSGGFTYFTSRVAKAAGFDDHRGNTLIDDGTALTGDVGRPILGRAAKKEALEAALDTHGLQFEHALSMGDGANDLAMIEAAGLGLAVHAKPVVAAASDAAINLTDLTAALYFQGYTDSEIIWSDY